MSCRLSASRSRSRIWLTAASDSRFASAVKKEDRKNSAEPTRIHNDHASSMSDGAPERDSVIQLERKSVMGRSPTEAEM